MLQIEAIKIAVAILYLQTKTIRKNYFQDVELGMRTLIVESNILMLSAIVFDTTRQTIELVL